ncbi:hypothetical protein J6590_012538 [Homalodisca vitripennis]|nr:hypothetical protein J6590_012538 [Homalodisca vitripennis]
MSRHSAEGRTSENPRYRVPGILTFLTKLNHRMSRHSAEGRTSENPRYRVPGILTFLTKLNHRMSRHSAEGRTSENPRYRVPGILTFLTKLNHRMSRHSAEGRTSENPRYRVPGILTFLTKLNCRMSRHSAEGRTSENPRYRVPGTVRKDEQVKTHVIVSLDEQVKTHVIVSLVSDQVSVGLRLRSGRVTARAEIREFVASPRSSQQRYNIVHSWYLTPCHCIARPVRYGISLLQVSRVTSSSFISVSSALADSFPFLLMTCLGSAPSLIANMQLAKNNSSGRSATCLPNLALTDLRSRNNSYGSARRAHASCRNMPRRDLTFRWRASK